MGFLFPIGRALVRIGSRVERHLPVFVDAFSAMIHDQHDWLAKS